MSAVRCLFPISDNDRKKLNQALEEQTRKIDEADTERFKSKWGFDPVTGQPVEGSNFEYTLMERHSMPALFTAVYRHRPSRPVSVLQTRSPARRNLMTLMSAPAKRKLRFDDSEPTNDENQDISETVFIPNKQAKSDYRPTTSNLEFNDVSVVNSLSSPPTSPPSSSLLSYNCPPSPSVLSSSCPPVLESDLDSARLCSVDLPGLSRSLSESTSLVPISPDSQAREYVTPHLRPKPVKLVQREITDYIRIKKHSSSLKASPSPRS